MAASLGGGDASQVENFIRFCDQCEVPRGSGDHTVAIRKVRRQHTVEFDTVELVLETPRLFVVWKLERRLFVIEPLLFIEK